LRKIVFTQEAFNEFTEWASIDKSIFKKIAKLDQEIQRNPFNGTGKPEPLKHNFKGFWSRQINKEHRIIYNVNDESINIISSKYHYQE